MEYSDGVEKKNIQKDPNITKDNGAGVVDIETH